MYKKGLRKSLNIGGFFQCAEYRRKFALEHPYYFNPCGTLIFSGPQGSGKTLSAVDYCTRVMLAYPLAILCTNTEFTDFPFNAELVLVDIESRDVITPQYIADRVNNDEKYRVCVEYIGLDCLKWINNSEYGVLFFIDEFHLECCDCFGLYELGRMSRCRYFRRSRLDGERLVSRKVGCGRLRCLGRNGQGHGQLPDGARYR